MNEADDTLLIHHHATTTFMTCDGIIVSNHQPTGACRNSIPKAPRELDNIPRLWVFE
jgi:hypothetical protein